MASLLAQPYSSRQATYDLRRLRRKSLITRVPGSQRYYLTGLGRQAAVLFTKAHTRVLAPGLALIDPTLPPRPCPAKRSCPCLATTGPRPRRVRRPPTPRRLKLDQPVNFTLGKPSLGPGPVGRTSRPARRRAW